MLVVMATVVFIDLWPEVAKRGYWKKRFAAVPVAIIAAGYRPEVHHYTRLDVRALIAAPPAGIILSGSRSNLLADASLRVCVHPNASRVTAGASNGPRAATG
jgi:hypothetical protein